MVAVIQFLCVLAFAVLVFAADGVRDWTGCSSSCGGGTRKLLQPPEWTIPCNTQPCNYKRPRGCKCGSADILFLLDRSHSITEENYWRVKQFMQDFVKAYSGAVDQKTSKTSVSFAAVSYDRYAQIEFDFSERYTLANMDDLTRRIWDMEYDAPEHGTNTPEAMYIADRLLRQQGRPDRPHLVIIISDGKSTFKQFFENAVGTVHGQFRSVFVAGIGELDADQLYSHVQGDHTRSFELNTVDQLPTIIQSIVDTFSCQSVKKACSKVESETCNQSCGPGQQQTVTHCKILDSDGNIVSDMQPYWLKQECCQGPCLHVSDYCSMNPCGRGQCANTADGYECIVPMVCPT